MKEPDKEWNFGRFRVKMHKCTKCGNQFREYFKEDVLKFVLSAHTGGLGRIRATKETMDRHKTYQKMSPPWQNLEGFPKRKLNFDPLSSKGVSVVGAFGLTRK